MVLCNVYRSERKAETYLYVALQQPFEELPAALREAFGPPTLVMQLRLSETRPLARVDVRQVMEQIKTQGFYLQLPPELPVEEEISRRFAPRRSGNDI